MAPGFPRSTLDMLLDSIMKKDDNTQQDMPPALPQRPPSSPRARLPSSLRSRKSIGAAAAAVAAADDKAMQNAEEMSLKSPTRFCKFAGGREAHVPMVTNA